MKKDLLLDSIDRIGKKKSKSWKYIKKPKLVFKMIKYRFLNCFGFMKTRQGVRTLLVGTCKTLLKKIQIHGKRKFMYTHIYVHVSSINSTGGRIKCTLLNLLGSIQHSTSSLPNARRTEVNFMSPRLISFSFDTL